MILKFFGNTCPEEFSEDCKKYLETFMQINEEMNSNIENFIEFLISSDEKMKEIEKNVNKIK